MTPQYISVLIRKRRGEEGGKGKGWGRDRREKKKEKKRNPEQQKIDSIPA